MQTTLVNPNERIDKEDLDNFTAFSKEYPETRTKLSWLDVQSRILSGFRVELPDQNLYPGRVVVHAGGAFDIDGELLFNETQLDVSRTITLVGAATTFYLEVMFVQADAVLDSRGFWDPTVDQGTDPSGDPKPDGQEFTAATATRRVLDWKIVQPIRVDNFTRNAFPTVPTPYIPLVKLITDGANKITVAVNPALTTGKAATTILEVISVTKIRVQDSTLLPDAGGTMIVGDGLAAPPKETVTVALNDRETNIITMAPAMVNVHYPGEVIRGGAAEPPYITESTVGRFAKSYEANAIDYRDMMFRGDEEHGHILAKSHSGIAVERSDVNLKSLKDYVDFLSAQIEELKWGDTSPFTSGVSVNRTPPGVVTNINTYPRYTDKSSGVNGARTASVTVGDGIKSWGDFVGNTDVALQAAIDALPATGGTLFIRMGDYSLTANVNITSDITIIADHGAFIGCDGGYLHIATTGRVALKGLNIKPGVAAPSYTGIRLDTSTPWAFTMEDCYLLNEMFEIRKPLPGIASITRCFFHGTIGAFAANSLVKIAHADGVIAGTWSECDFMNTVAVGLNGTCIDASTGTTGVVLAEFVNCSFSSTSAVANWEIVHLGTAPSNVRFSQCGFLSVATIAYITLTTGQNIYFNNCYGMDNVSCFLSATSSSKVYVDGYLTAAAGSTTLPQIAITNCSDVGIRNCKLKGSSVASLTWTPIYVVCTALTVRTIIIENNIINFTTNLGTGIIFDIAGGLSIENVTISNNQFNQCECGLYFNNSGAVAAYNDINIIGNSFFDEGLITSAIYQKVGVFGDSKSSKSRWVFSDNSFTNFNPTNANLCGAATRNAVYIASAANYSFIFKGNRILNVGNPGGAGAWLLADTAAFRMNSAYNSIFSGNTVLGVYGTYAYGIKADVTLTKCMISNNLFSTIWSTANEAYGIFTVSLTSDSIVGNTFESILSIASSAADIGTFSTATATWSAVEISGNTFKGASVTTYAILVLAKSVRQVSIIGNTSTGNNLNFINLLSVAGGFVEDIIVTGNVGIDSLMSPIVMNGNTAATKGIVISSNTLKITTAQPLVSLTGINFGLVIIANNTLESTAVAIGVINMISTLHAKVTGNFCQCGAGAAAIGILMGAGCDHYTIQNNTCNIGAVGGAHGIQTTAAATTTGQVSYNFLSIVADLHLNDVNVGDTTF